MKAIVYTQYGPPDVLQFKEVAIPKPADNQVLVKICAASVNPLDSGVMRGTGRLTGTGLLKPRQKALGSDFAGRVEGVGLPDPGAGQARDPSGRHDAPLRDHVQERGRQRG